MLIYRNFFRNEDIDDTSLCNCTASIAAILPFKSWSRPGAVINLTINEYNNHELVENAEGEVIVLRVKNHKTGLAGSAKLMLTPADFTKLNAYVDVIRPVMDANQDAPNLLAWGHANPKHAQLNGVPWLQVQSEHFLSYVGKKNWCDQFSPKRLWANSHTSAEPDSHLNRNACDVLQGDHRSMQCCLCLSCVDLLLLIAVCTSNSVSAN